jgi:hypothetical protein
MNHIDLHTYLVIDKKGLSQIIYLFGKKIWRNNVSRKTQAYMGG